MKSETGRPFSKGSRIIGVLDVGTSKLACLIADVASGREASDPDAFRILAFETQASRGVKAGVVVDLAKAEEAVRAVIARAEQRAGVTLPEVFVSVSCGRLGSELFTARAPVEGGAVTAADLSRLNGGARAYAERDGRMLLHMNRLVWRINGAPCQVEPVGLAAASLGAGMHAVTADEPPVRNLLYLVERSLVLCAGLVAAPYASALAASSEEERRLGVTVIDIGAGCTTLATFAEGHLVKVDAIPVGGGIVTQEIARSLHTPLEGAERIKSLYGTLVTAPSDEHEYFSYAVSGEEGEVHRTTKAYLSEIIRPRVAYILDLAGERLAAEGAADGERIVFTGGASEMTGMADFASSRFGVPVRVGRPQSWPGLPPLALHPQFSTVAGLLVAAQGGDAIVAGRRQNEEDGYIERVGKWLRDGFQ